MYAFFARRLAGLVPVVVVVGVVAFLLIHLTPGNPADVILGNGATPSQVAQLTHQLGLDKSLWQQFGIWAGDALRGDLGRSIFFQQPVASVVLSHLVPTAYLALLSTLVSLIVAWPLGTLAGWRRGGRLDRAFMMLSMVGNSIPGFWLALMLIIAFAVQIRIFPVTGYAPPSQGLRQWIMHLVLPVAVLAVNQAPIIARMLRDGVADNATKPYVRTARAKGASERQVLIGHVVPNAAVPTLIVIGTSLATLLSGAVVVEVVFNIPGIGNLLFQAVENRDYPLVQGTALIFALGYVLVNLVVDFVYSIADPRVRA